jgi:hypothetical protein
MIIYVKHSLAQRGFSVYFSARRAVLLIEFSLYVREICARIAACAQIRLKGVYVIRRGDGNGFARSVYELIAPDIESGNDEGGDDKDDDYDRSYGFLLRLHMI